MSFKSEFSEIYNYLSDCCKDPIITMAYASESDFDWKDNKASTGVIIKYNGSSEVVKVPNGVVEIGSRNDDGEYDPVGCFEGCAAITHIILPKSLKKIGTAAFFYCESLESIDIPNGVTEIDDSAFSHCNSLTSIDIPNSVKSIGVAAFNDCESLASINIPDSVKSIGESAFYGCLSLTSLNIPNSVTSIGKSAFGCCYYLKQIICSVDLNLSGTSYPIDCKIIRR